MKRRTLIAIAAILLLCTAAFGFHRWRQFARLEQVKAELRAEGIPLSEEEWAAKYVTIPGGIDELDDVLARITQRADNRSGQWNLGPGAVANAETVSLNGGDVSRYDLDVVQRYLAVQTEDLAVLAGIAERYIPVESGTQAPVMVYNSKIVVPLWRAADLYSVRAQFRVRDGDVEGAVADAVSARRIGDFLAGTGFLRYRILESAARAMREVLSDTAISREQLDALSAVWQERDVAREWRMASEMAYCERWSLDASVLMATWQKHYAQSETPGRDNVAARALAILYAPRLTTYWLHEPGDQARLLEGYRRLVAITSDPPEQWHDETAELAQWAAESPRAYHRVVWGSAFSVDEATFPTHDLAWTRVVNTVLAVERYRLATGGVPDTLESLVPIYLDAVPVDPWTGEASQYPQPANQTYLVQSAGYRGRGIGATLPEARIEVVRP